MKPRVRLVWTQWLLGFDVSFGMVYVYVGPIEIAW